MKNLAQLRQFMWALGVLLLFLAGVIPVNAAVKKQKELKQVIPWREIESVVQKAMMESNQEKAMELYYTFPDTLDDRLDELDVTAEEFHALAENNNRPPESPKSVDILKKYDYRKIKENTVGIFYAARYLPRAGGSLYDTVFLTKTDDGWKIDPSFSFWFVRKSCISPREWTRTDRGWRRVGANASCDNSEKAFRKIPKTNASIGAKVRDWAKPFLVLQQSTADTTTSDDTSKIGGDNSTAVEPGG